MATPSYAVMSLSLAELKLLGGFVRRQDLDTRLAAARASDAGPRAYPLFHSRLPADEEIDIFVEPEWRRVRFLGLADGRVHYREPDEIRSIAYDPYRVAPAGYFTDQLGEVPNAETAVLLDSYEPPITGHDIRSASLERVAGPYLTFEIRTYDRNARRVEESDMRVFSVSVHMLDPRVRIDGVRSRPPLHNVVLAVSHRWLSPSEPDPKGAQFQELMRICASLGLSDCQPFAIDYCALPQQPRTPDEDEVFRRELPEFQKLFGRHTIVLGEGSGDYGTRGWCMLELMQASVQNAIVNPDVLEGGLAKAYDLAKGFADSAKWNMQELGKAVTRGGPNPLRGWMSNMTSVGLYNQAISEQQRILDMFENEFQVADEADRPIILQQVREQFHLMKHRAPGRFGLGAGEPLRKA